ncbi:glycosyltransferase family 92 protein [Anderseniella sp. Alg231-50]|uniref:glycosyltransferase family 92 protein n=1 Tax=Anderseniella sp. Alg231-50 TaxID=1922226 RepID=UPI00307C85AD
MFSIKPETLFKLEQRCWQLAGMWRAAAKRRLWLPQPVAQPGSAEHYLCVFAIVRNESPYIGEWIEFHRMMGVSHFFIYDNGSNDGTAEQLSPYVKEGLVTVVNWADFLKGWEGVAGSKGRSQKLAMLHCIANFGHLAEWMAFIDADEFLFPTSAGSLTEVLHDYEDLDSLSVYWHMFGTSGHARKPPGLVTENYTQRLRKPKASCKHLSRVKTIVRPSAVRGVHNSHVFILRHGYPESWTEQREKIGHADHRLAARSTDVLRINHYYSKSLAEYRERRSVPLLGQRSDFRGDDQLLRHIESDTVGDISIQRFVPALRSRLSAESADGNVVQMIGPKRAGRDE